MVISRNGLCSHSTLLLIVDPAGLPCDEVSPTSRVATLLTSHCLRITWVSSWEWAIDRVELDEEVHGPEWLDMVLDIWGYRLGSGRIDDRSTRRRAVPKPSVANDDASPGTRGYAVIPAEARWHRVLVPHRAGTHEAEIVG